MKKIIATTLILTFMLGVGVAAHAIELGLTQDSFGYTNLRFDSTYTMGELRMGTPNLMKVGAKYPLPYGLYLIGNVSFVRNDINYFETNTINLGVGIESEGEPINVRGELTVRNPNWNKYNDASIPILASFGIEFSTNALFGGGE